MNMLVIGKSRKFYTLWDIQEEVKTSRYNDENYTVVHYAYLRNLSMDLDKAMQKAPGLEVNESLHGHKSFSVIKKDEKSGKKEMMADEFPWGKYSGKKIAECVDYNYMGWMINQNSLEGATKDLMESILTEQGWVRVNDMVMLDPKTAAELEERIEKVYELKEKIDNQDPISFATEYGVDYDEKLEKPCYHLNKNTKILFNKFVSGNYRGHWYPILLNNKGKQVKSFRNKIVTIQATGYEIVENEYGWGPEIKIFAELTDVAKLF